MPKKKIDMMLVVRGDYNDADFCTKITPITQEQLDRYAPVIEALKGFKKYTGKSDPKRHPGSTSTHTHDHNWPIGEYGCREDLGEKTLTELYGELAEEFNEEFVPNGGEGGGYSLHDIVEIYVVKFDYNVFVASNHYKNWAITG